MEAGLASAMRTGKALAVVTRQRFGVSYHPQSVARLLHELGFSVQRPRKRLSRADAVTSGKDGGSTSGKDGGF